MLLRAGRYAVLVVASGFAVTLSRTPPLVLARDRCGRLAQLVERLVYTEDVGSSSLSPPTISNCGLWPEQPRPQVWGHVSYFRRA